MKSILSKIIIFLIIFVTFNMSNSLAIDMFLTNSNNNSNEIISNEVVTNQIGNNNIQEENDSNSTAPTVTKVQSTSSVISSQEPLTTTNKIDIILIAVCFVLILLAIAILIRLK